MIGFIGLGLMGKPMAKNLLKAGFPLVVHSRSPAPVDELVAAGAERAASPADVARRATRIFTMLPDSPDVEHVLEGPDGIFGALQPGTIIIDTSSISPAVARRLAAKAQDPRRGDAGRAGERRRDRRDRRHAVDHGGRRCRGVRGREAAARRRRQSRESDPHWRFRRGADLQGVQPDGDRRHAGRGRRRRSRSHERQVWTRRACATRSSADSPPAASSKSTANAS